MTPTFLPGERIYLRGLRREDVTDAYCRWMNDLEVTQYLETRFWPQSKDQIERFLVDTVDNRDYSFLAIVLNDGDRHIGNIKLGPIKWIHRTADIGLLIGEKDAWGKGFATEAIRLVTDYAFQRLNLHKVAAGCYSTNKGSAAAFLKAGFTQEGRRLGQFYNQGGYVDELLFGRVAP